MKVLCSLILIFLCSCSHHQPKYPLTFKKYKNDKVTVQTAANLALTSYAKGCMDHRKIVNKKKDYNQCVEKGKKHIKENVIYILDQN